MFVPLPPTPRSGSLLNVVKGGPGKRPRALGQPPKMSGSVLGLFALLLALAPAAPDGDADGADYWARTVSASGAVPGVPATSSRAHLLARFEFDDGGLDGWARASPDVAASSAEVQSEARRYMRVRGQFAAVAPLQSGGDHGAMQHAPWVDSPVLGPFAVTDATFAVVRMRHLFAGFEAVLQFRNSSLVDIDNATGSWDVRFSLRADGRFHSYAVPILETRFAVPTVSATLSQMRLYPSVKSLAAPLRSNATMAINATNPSSAPPFLSPFAVGTVLVDYVRIAQAPSVLRVEGCSPVSSAFDARQRQRWHRDGRPDHIAEADRADGGASPLPQPLSPTDHLPPPYRPTIRRGHALNKYYQSVAEALVRVNSSANAALPFGSTFNCALSGGDRLVISGIHFGVSAPLVWIDGVPCRDVELLSPETALRCITPPGAGVNVGVTVANAAMPVLRDVKPFLSYSTGSQAPQRPLVSNIGARALDVSWLCPQSYWECMATTGYELQWRAAVLDDVEVGDTSGKAARSAEAGAVIGVDGGGFVVQRPRGAEDPSLCPGGSASRVHSQAVQNDMIQGVGVGHASLGGDGSADDIILEGIYAADLSLFQNGTDEESLLVSVASGASYSYTAAALARSRGAVAPFASPGGRFIGGAYVSGPAPAALVAPDVAWGPWGSAPGGGTLFVVNQTTTSVLGLEPARRYQFRVASLSETTGLSAAAGAAAAALSGDRSAGGFFAWAVGDDVYGHRDPPRPGRGTVRGAFSAASEDARTLAFDFFFTHFDANATLDHGPAYANSSVNGLHWAGGEGAFGLTLVGDASIGNANGTHTCCDHFGAVDGDGGLAFADAVRFLDGWPQERTHAPLYRYESSTSDYTPIALSWARERAAADALFGGTVQRFAQAVNRGAYAAAVQALAAAAEVGGVSSGAGEAAEDLGGGSPLVAPLGVKGDVAGAAQPALRRERLSSADALLSRSLGRSPSGSWFSLLKEEPSVWDAYDDAGTLAFVPLSLVAQLDAQAEALYLASLARGEDVGGATVPNSAGGTTQFVLWPYPGLGSSIVQGLNDSRVSPDEAAHGPLRVSPSESASPLPSASVSASASASVSASLSASASASASAGGAKPSASPTHSTTTSTSSSATPTTSSSRSATPTPTFNGGNATARYDRGFTTTPAFLHRDRAGRRLVGLAADPRSSCTLLCTATGAARSPVLNSQAQRGSEVYRNGMFAGVATKGSASAAGVLLASDDAKFGLTGEVPEADTAPDSRSAFGPSGIFGAAEVNGTAAGLDFRSGALDMAAPVQGRFSRTLTSLVGSEPLPSPDSTFASPVVVVDASKAPRGAGNNATAPCGPALRLTASRSSQTGAAWYSRPQQVGEGFDTTFVARLSSPSSHCRTNNDASTRCRARGGSGLAFVVQTLHSAALGNGGSGQGFAGIRRSVAVELDTWADAELLDPLDNHVSVHTRGMAGNSASHSFSIGSARFGRVGDLTDGAHVVRILYEPTLSSSLAGHAAFVPSAGFTSWLDSAQAGFGALAVYIDDEQEPVLIVPLDLDSLLGLAETHGRAWVGFTAATGADVWQTHDILAWQYTSLRCLTW